MNDIFYFETPFPEQGLPLFDSHAHLQYPEYDNDREETIQRAKEAGIKYIVCIGTNLEDSINAINLAKKYPGYIFATVGNHPYQADKTFQEFQKLIIQNQDLVVGVGETGLDYFRSPVDKNTQKKSFIQHCNLAKQFDLPVIVHLREFADCYHDAKQILLDTNTKKAIFHCYTGDLESAKDIWLNKWKTSFSLITFYKNNQKLKEVYDQCPLNLKLLETDCPYLPPNDKRGQRNEPSYLDRFSK